MVLGDITVQAADLAILRNGNSIRHERRQVVGPITRLYLSESGSGYIEIPTDQIERFERDTAPSPASSAPVVKAETKPALKTSFPLFLRTSGGDYSRRIEQYGGWGR